MKYENEIKLKNINLTKDNFYIAIDFDRTITASNSCDSWDATGKLLGIEFKERILSLYNKYRPIELDYKITVEEKLRAMETWYQSCMNLYHEYHLTKIQLEQSISQSEILFRNGAKEFLDKMAKYNIPVIILSAGIGNVIEQFLKENECYTKNISIISNFITFDNKGNMNYFKGPMIHTLNKTMVGHLPVKLEQELKKKTYRILFRRYNRR